MSRCKRFPYSPWWSACATAAVALGLAVVLSAGQLTERPIAGVTTHPAIAYATRPTSDVVATLAHRVGEPAATLRFDEQSGYLRSVLDALRVPIESQVLVMSKTGVQALHTDPSNPRAIYFNDSVAVGYIRGAPLLEFAVQDPEQGIVFYTIDQKPQTRVVFDRPSSCIRCHQVYSTLHVPGMLARSQFVAADGLPLGQFGTYDLDDRTPFRRRWGGWYVTGTHGAMRHMGNATVTNRDSPETAIGSGTLNRTALDGLFDGQGYPSANSDIAALMVFEHQMHMMNLLTRIGWESRIAAHDGHADFSAGSLRDGINELTDYLLFVNEEPLTAPVKGTTAFAVDFAARGPKDRRGRSLRDLDLQTRLFTYRCSYMIYSPAFRALPDPARRAIYARVRELLSSRADGNDVLEILADTVPDF